MDDPKENKKSLRQYDERHLITTWYKINISINFFSSCDITGHLITSRVVTVCYNRLFGWLHFFFPLSDFTGGSLSSETEETFPGLLTNQLSHR